MSIQNFNFNFFNENEYKGFFFFFIRELQRILLIKRNAKVSFYLYRDNINKLKGPILFKSHLKSLPIHLKLI